MIENRKNTETLDDYTLRMIESRVENGFEYDELYETLLGEEYAVSPTESRKRTRGIRDYLLKKAKMSEVDVNKELARLSEKETFEMRSDNTQILQKFVLSCEEDLKSPDKIMEILGYDPLEFELISSKTSRWNVSSGTGNSNHKVLYALKATVKPRKIKVSSDKVIDVINSLTFDLNDIKNYEYMGGEFVLEIPMMDVHFNKVSDERITGNYSNSETIKTDFLSVIYYFLSKAQDKTIKEIIFPIGQDYFNSEASGTTTHGTPQDNDLPADLMFEEGTNLLFQAIELCRAVAPVKIDYVAGNHDTNIGYYAASSLKRAYELADIKGVEFDILPKRKYYEFGKCLIGYTHGNKERTRIEKENIMQVEAPEAWGRTKFREWHVGHEHHEEVRELGGIKYRKINSITANDNWHYESGYVGSLRMAQAFLWHKELGLLDIYNCPILN